MYQLSKKVANVTNIFSRPIRCIIRFTNFASVHFVLKETNKYKIQSRQMLYHIYISCNACSILIYIYIYMIQKDSQISISRVTDLCMHYNIFAVEWFLPHALSTERWPSPRTLPTEQTPVMNEPKHDFSFFKEAFSKWRVLMRSMFVPQRKINNIIDFIDAELHRKPGTTPRRHWSGGYFITHAELHKRVFMESYFEDENNTFMEWQKLC